MNFFKDNLQKNPTEGSVAIQAIRIDIASNYFAEIILCALLVLRGQLFFFCFVKVFYHKVHEEHEGKMLRILF